MKQLLLFIFSFFLCLTGIKAQTPEVPTPAPPQSELISLVGATAHLGTGEVIENSLIQFVDGKITLVDKASNAPSNLGKVINVEGKHIYPGFIAAHTAIGLAEVAAVRSTRDYNETGHLNPNVRSIIAYNTDSKVIPTLRSNGILLAQVAPRGGIISGQSSVVELDAWNWEDAAYQLDEGIFVNWPEQYSFQGWWAEPGGVKKNKKYEAATTKIADLLAEAKAYCQEPNPETTNLKLAAMCGLFDGTKKWYVRAEMIKEIIDAVNLAKQYDLKVAIVGGTDAWMATDVLKENEVAVIINRVQSLPNREDEDIDLAYRLPKMLQDAGINYAISVGSGWDGFWDQRNLPFHAGMAVNYGLTKEQAIQAMTLNAAQILGIEETVGSVEVGKDATLIVSTGDVLDMRTSHIEQAFIRGKMLDLDNKQKALYRKFMGKYNLNSEE